MSNFNYKDYFEPLVPLDLIEYVCGHRDFEEFMRSGMEVFQMLDLAALKHSKKHINGFNSILDFGCGCGRILRFLNKKGLNVSGCDINQKLIDYCKNSYEYCDTYNNDLFPPLKYKNNSFDLIYSFSVFSHLSIDVEKSWLEELLRVGAPGCLYLITIQGDWFIEKTLSPSEISYTEENGFYFKKIHTRSDESSDLNFPEYYESSYKTSEYIRKNWSAYFEVLDVVKGDDPSRYLIPGKQFEPIGSIPKLRPMGQDLVIARKR